MASRKKKRAVKLDRKEKAKYDKAFELVEKVRRYSKSIGDYRIFESFFEVVVSYKQGLIKDKPSVLRMGRKIFADLPEFLREFEVFYAEKIPDEVDQEEEKEEEEKQINNARAFKKPRLTCKLSNRPIPEETPNNNNRQVAHKGEKRKLRRARFSNKTRVTFVPSLPPIPEESPADNCDQVVHQGKKRILRSASASNICGPSYRKILKYSPARKDQKSEVLNHEFEIKIPEKSSAPRAMSKVEEKVIAFEDKCYPIDMHFHWTISAIKSAEKLLRLLEENPNFEIPIRVKDHLTIFALNCIRDNLFETNGGRAIEVIRTNPRRALPVLIQVLKEKKDLCQEFRKKMKFR